MTGLACHSAGCDSTLKLIKQYADNFTVSVCSKCFYIVGIDMGVKILSVLVVACKQNKSKYKTKTKQDNPPLSQKKKQNKPKQK